jgi:hypothetical protein
MTRLLRPDVRCPQCMKPPGFRVSELFRDRFADENPTDIVGTLQCNRCGVCYDLTARAIQRAA